METIKESSASVDKQSRSRSAPLSKEVRRFPIPVSSASTCRWEEPCGGVTLSGGRLREGESQ
jgi:hypothetical protein